ncbi:MAG: SpoIIE family protein phosphatase [Actinobacteria bacterium]|nr:SpoIIE family protein phosphatase [Actinomycetota bacterium]
MGEIVKRDHLSRIIDTIEEGVIVFDANGQAVFANSSAEIILGLKRKTIIGQSYSDPALKFAGKNGEALPEMELPFARVITGRPVLNEEFVAKRPDGAKVVLSVKAVPFHDETGAVVNVIQSFMDVTGRKTTELLLEESEERYYRLAEYLPDMIAIHSDWRFVYINPTGARMLGARKPQDIVGKPVLRYIHPDYRGATKERILLAQQGVAVGMVEEKYLLPDGRLIEVESISIPTIYRGRTSIQVVSRDITERKRTEAQLKRAKDLSDALNRINAAINSTLNFDAIMQRVVNESAKALGSETAGIALREEGYWVTRYVYGLPNIAVGSKIREEEAVITRIAIETGKPVPVDDIYTDERVNHKMMEKHGIRAFMVVPIILRGEAIGALSFNYYRAVTFTDEQIDFAGKLAMAISLALENSRLYTTERNIANTLQEALLILPSEVEGIDIDHFYHSATDTFRVGGDFYDLFELEHDRVGIVIGDVSGKGLQAATLTSLVKNTIKAYAYENSSPALIVSKTNDVTTKSSPAASFITLFFGILDIGSGRLSYCSAGHLPPIVKRSGAGSAFLITRSPIIGAFAGLNYFDDVEVLAPKDILVLYTDGTTEARRDQEFFGEERLRDTVQKTVLPSAKGFPASIFNNIIEFTGGRLLDDLAILAVSLKG